MKSPIITRKYADQLKREAVTECEERNSRLRDQFAKVAEQSREAAKKDWERNYQPVLERMLSIGARRRYDRPGFVLNFDLDREYMEIAASRNDPHIWRYIANMIAERVRAELSTMNFAGLHQLADDCERRYRRSIPMPMSGPVGQ